MMELYFIHSDGNDWIEELKSRQLFKDKKTAIILTSEYPDANKIIKITLNIEGYIINPLAVTK